MPSLIIYSRRVLIGDTLQEASLFIQDGCINDIKLGKHDIAGWTYNDFGDSVVFPGVIDAHIHINEPGRTSWEGFHTATQAAAGGGITTLIDMPLNSSPVTIDPISFKKKVEASHNQRHVHCGFWGGLVPANAQDLSSILDTGILGIKAFLTHSGIEEFPNVSLQDLRFAMPQIAEARIPLLVHCELDQDHAGIDIHKNNPQNFQSFVDSRPPSWENEAVRQMINLCRDYKCPVHIVHLSSAEVLPDILKAKDDGLALTVETCPHYLFFNSDSIPDADTRFKCTPPIRDKKNNDLLWQALESGLIDFVSTDHSPAPSSLKESESGNLFKAWGGIVGGQFLLSATWTIAKERGISLSQLANWLCKKPAQFIGYSQSKGKIKKGFDADLLVWNPDKSYKITENLLFHKQTYSPYVGSEVFGDIIATYCKGEPVFINGQFDQLKRGDLLIGRNDDRPV